MICRLSLILPCLALQPSRVQAQSGCVSAPFGWTIDATATDAFDRSASDIHCEPL